MAEITPDVVLDVRGEACPYPFIRTKWLRDLGQDPGLKMKAILTSSV